MEKLTVQQGQSQDIVADNIAKLKQLFPEILTEKKIDFAVLKQLLGDEVEEAEERYSFTWNGKARARHLAQTPSTGTLRPCKEESKDWDTTQNLFIEGDNLEVLKLLQKSYHQKVKMIYIDPPYNTGKDFIYPDDFRDNIKNYLELTGQTNEAGKKLSANAETSGRYHTDWLNMMYPRLKLARNLMADDALIAITIDDGELFQLGKLMDEIFGESSRLACAPWLSEASGGKEKTGLRTGHEYVLIYFKNSSENISKEERSTGDLNLKDRQGVYRKGRELMKWGGTSLKADRPKQFYELPTPNGDRVLPYRNDGQEGHWRWGRGNEMIKCALSDFSFFHWEVRPFDDGVKVNGATERWVPYEKIRDIKKSVGWSTWLDKFGTNADATREMKELFGAKPFDTPKPVSLIKWLINIHNDEDALILDFFAGSASTAHAVFDVNQEDDGKRKFIMVQLPEVCDENSEALKAGYKTITDIGKDRIRRAGAKILADNADKPGIQNLDIGFKVFKLDSSNIKPWDADFDTLTDDLLTAGNVIKPERNADDVLFEILLKYGLDLTLPIATHTLAGKTVFEVGAGALLVCLEEGVTEAVAEAIGQLKTILAPAVCRVVFKDAGFADDAAKVNAVQVLKQFGIDDVKSL